MEKINKEMPLSRKILIDLGFEEKEAKIILNTSSSHLLKDSTLVIKIYEIYDFLINLGYTKNDIIKMAKMLSNIFCYNVENMQQKIEDMMLLGYTKVEVMKMIKNLPSIFCYTIENIKQKIEDMMDLGYTRDEVIEMSKQHYAIFSYNIETIKLKIDNIVTLGYTKEQVIEMTKKFPAIFGFSIENIKEKIEFYDSINMHELALLAPKQLMQSVSLSYARYKYYEEKDIVIGMANYRKLFHAESFFQKSSGLTKKQLLEKYDYSEYMKEMKNGRNI